MALLPYTRNKSSIASPVVIKGNQWWLIGSDYKARPGRAISGELVGWTFWYRGDFISKKQRVTVVSTIDLNLICIDDFSWEHPQGPLNGMVNEPV